MHVRDVPPLVARLASEQHGTVSREQLLDAGVDRDWIKRAVRAGRLLPLHRGVYAVGHLALTPESHLMAALLACGPRAVLSHRSAAIEWTMLRPEPDAVIDVTITEGHRRPRPGIRLHHAPLAPDERGRRQNLAITGPLRTLLDLAAAEDRHLARAAEQAELGRLVSRAAIEGTRGPGSARLKAAIGDTAPTLTRSGAERRLLMLILKARLPRPETNVKVNGDEVDALWRPQRLIAEFDSWEFHRTKQAFERDRRRDAEHLAAGYRTLRLTWRQLTREPAAVAAQLGAALASAPLARAHLATYPHPP